MYHEQNPRRRKALLVITLIGNLGMLGFFKYFNFFAETKTKGNTLYSCYKALARSYTYLTPEFWGKPSLERDLIPVEKKVEDNEDDM